MPWTPGCSTNCGPGHADDIQTKEKVGVPGSIGVFTTAPGALQLTHCGCTRAAIRRSVGISKSVAREAPSMVTGCIGQPEAAHIPKSRPESQYSSNDSRENVPSVASISARTICEN